MSELTLQTKSLSKTHLPLESVRLEVLEGDARGASALLTSGTLIAGGSSRADFIIREATVSARHASFELLRGAVRVRDLQSRNGTFFLGAAGVVSAGEGRGVSSRHGAAHPAPFR